jgi:beta-lysine N6-acetyltransferase
METEMASSDERVNRSEENESTRVAAGDATEETKPNGAELDESTRDEWAGLEPSGKEMGLVRFTLDKGVKTTVVGTVYGMDFEIERDSYSVEVFFDYYNRRLKVVSYEAEDYGAMLKRLAYLAESNDFDKIFLKAGRDDFQQFLSHGYMMEGVLRYYFKGDDAYVLSRFSSAERVQSEQLLEEAQLIEKLIYESGERREHQLPTECRVIRAGIADIPDLVGIYRCVFETYPSPLTNPDYVEATMKRNVIYRLVKHGGQALAAASAEMNHKHSNAEMTDCATIPEAQGRGLVQLLLLELEGDLRAQGICSAYTLARGLSYGMNRAFFRLGYEFSGRLINNCDIFGQFEDMNIWVKRLIK